jgi:DNA-binding MarR family transcriptional regulator
MARLHENGDGEPLAVLLNDGFRLIEGYVHARLAAAGFDDVRPAHLVVFQNLDSEGSRIGEIAERARLTNQSVGYLVDYLEEHGYVERAADPRNRRATLVRLTERGWAEMAVCAEALAEVEQRLAAAIGTEKLRDLRESLASLRRTIRTLP